MCFWRFLGPRIHQNHAGLELVETFIVSDGFRVCEEDQKAKPKAGRIAVEMVQPYQEYRPGGPGWMAWLDRVGEYLDDTIYV